MSHCFKLNSANTSTQFFCDATVSVRKFGAYKVNSIRGNTPGAAPPSAPGHLSARLIDDHTARLAWSRVHDGASGVHGYAVYRDGHRIGDVSWGDWPSDAFVDEACPERATVTYTVKTVNRACVRIIGPAH